MQTPIGSVVAASAISKHKHDEALREPLLQLAIADLATLIAASLVGYGTARAALNPVERYRLAAESADGARIWSHRLENTPQGEGAWWQTALRDRLAPEFAVGEAGAQGDWKTVRLVDRGAEPYTWIIAVRVVGDHLDLVQVYYPSAAAEARYGAAVAAVLAGVGA